MKAIIENKINKTTEAVRFFHAFLHFLLTRRTLISKKKLESISNKASSHGGSHVCMENKVTSSQSPL